MSEFYLRGGQHFSKDSEIQKKLDYLVGGGEDQALLGIFPKKNSYFDFDSSPNHTLRKIIVRKFFFQWRLVLLYLL